MILKYFHYHVGSCVSKNTRGGDTIRLLIKLIVMEEWHRDGEEVLENILRILRGWGNISDVRRRSRRTRRYCLNLEGWGGYFSNTSEPCLCHFHCNLRKINYPLFHNGGIDQYTPSSRGGVLTNIPPLDNSKILLMGVLTNIPPPPEGGYWPIYPLERILLLSRWVYPGKYPAIQNTIIYFSPYYNDHCYSVN